MRKRAEDKLHLTAAWCWLFSYSCCCLVLHRPCSETDRQTDRQAGDISCKMCLSSENFCVFLPTASWSVQLPVFQVSSVPCFIGVISRLKRFPFYFSWMNFAFLGTWIYLPTVPINCCMSAIHKILYQCHCCHASRIVVWALSVVTEVCTLWSFWAIILQFQFHLCWTGPFRNCNIRKVLQGDICYGFQQRTATPHRMFTFRDSSWI